MEINKVQTVRVSNHKMMDMDECYEKIKSLFTEEEISKRVENIETRNSINRISSSDVFSSINIPSNRKSTMDGFAVQFKTTDVKQPLEVVDKIFAGKAISQELQNIQNANNKCVYITTGASLPNWCDSVIPIEYTILNKENNISILEDIVLAEKTFIREIGSDLKKGDIVLSSNSVITVSDITMLISCKITHVSVYKQPVVGLISTGDEIYDLYNHSSNKLNLESDDFMVDSNKEMLKQMLIQSCHLNPNNIIDFGNLSDNYDLTEEKINNINGECDFLISSGGVSMGERDLIKLYLENNRDKINILFGRLNMKPGKPTTLAKLSKTIFFAFPGNPVSCFVTFNLLFCYSVNLFQNNTRFPLKSIDVKLHHEYTLDNERPEYARGIIYYNSADCELQVVINGNQQSSRIRSAQNTNCLVYLPKATSTKKEIKFNESVKCLLLNLGTNSLGSKSAEEVKELLQVLNLNTKMLKQDECLCSDVNSNSQNPSHNNFHKNKSGVVGISPECKRIESRIFTVGLITISDRASKGEYKDESTPCMEDFFNHFNEKYIVKIKKLVPDEKDEIAAYELVS